MIELTIIEQVKVRALKDPTFRQRLLHNPKAVLISEYHIQLPKHVVVHVLEEAPDTLTLVLPSQEETLQELADSELEATHGGIIPKGPWTSPPNSIRLA